MSFLLEITEDFYKAEVKNAWRFYEFMNGARKETNKSAKSSLGWFIDELVEEVSNAGALLARIRIMGERKHA